MQKKRAQKRNPKRPKRSRDAELRRLHDDLSVSFARFRQAVDTLEKSLQTLHITHGNSERIIGSLHENVHELERDVQQKKIR